MIQQHAERRAQLLEQLAPDSIAIVPAGELVTRSRDTEYTFRQNSDFFYLTGFNEPNAVLILSNLNGVSHVLLGCQEKDPMAEIWHGRRLGPDVAKFHCQVDEARGITDVISHLSELLEGHANVYIERGANTKWDEALFKCLDHLKQAKRSGKQAPTSVHDISGLIHEMRLFKSEYELSIMQQAADISVTAHKRAMAFVSPGCFEYQLEAEIRHEFAMSGARSAAYNSIVGGGENACILHYTENTDVLVDGSLVLIDAGAEYQGYAADITRTFPVNGQFSEPQKQLYNLVLDAQQAALQLLEPGATIEQANEASIRVITQGLLELGILKGTLADNLKNKTYRAYYMHGLSHWLGLDVHDVGDYKIDGVDRPLAPGMVITVEPGIYISETADVDSRWKSIGIRIEDNIAITHDGHTNLTAAAPKTVAEIEQWMQSQADD